LTDRYCELDCQRQSGSPPRTGKSALSRIVYTDNRYIDIVHSKCSDDHTRIIPVRLRILCKSLCSKRACRQECTEEFSPGLLAVSAFLLCRRLSARYTCRPVLGQPALAGSGLCKSGGRNSLFRTRYSGNQAEKQRNGLRLK